jgi:hypothetical protein
MKIRAPLCTPAFLRNEEQNPQSALERLSNRVCNLRVLMEPNGSFETIMRTPTANISDSFFLLSLKSKSYNL